MDFAPVQAEPFLVVVETTGQLHLRYDVGGRTVDDGRCGIDDNWKRADVSLLEAADVTRLCRHCWPNAREE